MSRLTHPKPGNFLRCLYCHYVFDDQRSQFESIIRALKGMGTFVDTDTCVQMVAGEVAIDGRYFHLSFDDGFRNVLTNAVPILTELEVPSILFVPTAFVGAEYAVIQDYCLRGYSAVMEMLDWDDLGKLVSLGHAIGSHTRTHARFSELSRSGKLQDEICGSKGDLEARLHAECRYISWPYGTRKDADDASLDMTRQAGYQACFGAFRGSVAPGETSLYSIPRHHFEAQWPLSHVKYFAAGNRED